MKKDVSVGVLFFAMFLALFLGICIGFAFKHCPEQKVCQTCEICEVCETCKECKETTCAPCVCNCDSAKITVQDSETYSEQKEICDWETKFGQHCKVIDKYDKIQEKDCTEGFYAYGDDEGCVCLPRECELEGY